MSENKVGRHAKARPTGESALRSAAAQAAGGSSAASRTSAGGGTSARRGSSAAGGTSARRGSSAAGGASASGAASASGRAVRRGARTRTAVKASAKPRLALKLPFKKSASKKARRRVNSENVRTALWLWCFPVGLSKMWRGACTWPRGVKVGITAAMAAVLVAIFAAPTPTADRYTTGIQMVADKPEVEVYGPALPNLIVQGYTRENTGSIIVDEVSSDVHYVYAADDADCYHEYECKFAFASSQRLTVYEAYHLGFKPCGRCNPPVYIPGETDPITAQPLHSEAAQPTTEEAAEETVE